MNVREQQEQIERQYLSSYACLSSESQGRLKPWDDCPIRMAFQRDRDRILHSKSFRRLKHKTQVFLLPKGDHYRTRLTHTLEVSQIARTIARALRLNEDLVEAIALGHDLGHTPFGHAGEAVLNNLLSEGFEHNVQSLRVVDYLENDGEGLNLTIEVRDGILNHKKSGKPSTLEGKVICYADRIAYLNHDIDDAVRAGILNEEDLPHECTDTLGNSYSERISTMIGDIIQTSMDENFVAMSADVESAMDHLRNFMFEYVYTNPVKSEGDKIDHLIRELYKYYLQYPMQMQEENIMRLDSDGLERSVADFISGMTDQYAIDEYKKLFIPRGWSV